MAKREHFLGAIAGNHARHIRITSGVVPAVDPGSYLDSATLSQDSADQCRLSRCDGKRQQRRAAFSKSPAIVSPGVDPLPAVLEPGIFRERVDCPQGPGLYQGPLEIGRIAAG